MNHLVTDTLGREYYWVEYFSGCLSVLPWGGRPV